MSKPAKKKKPMFDRDAIASHFQALPGVDKLAHAIADRIEAERDRLRRDQFFCALISHGHPLGEAWALATKALNIEPPLPEVKS